METALRPIRVFKERRAQQSGGAFRERRVFCWDIERCDPAVRAKCHAFIVQENCWDFWPLKTAKYKSCCHKVDDCRNCPILEQKFGTDQAEEPIPIYIRRPANRPPSRSVPGRICPNLQLLGANVPDAHALRRLIKEQESEERDVFRCRLRGVHLHYSYVVDICAARAATECAFL